VVRGVFAQAAGRLCGRLLAPKPGSRVRYVHETAGRHYFFSFFDFFSFLFSINVFCGFFFGVFFTC
jgi:hypothetical protein